MTAVAPARRSTWHDAFDAQIGLWRWLRTDLGMEYLRRNYELNTRGLRTENADFQLKLYANEGAKLLGANPFFVSAEMCEVVSAASASFLPEPLLPTDLLDACGFVYFERPFEILDRFDEPIDIAAISWTPLLGERSMDAVGGQFGSTDDALGVIQTRFDAKVAEGGSEEDLIGDGLALTLYSTTDDATRTARPDVAFPPILICHLTPWWFGMTFDGNEVDENGKPTGAAWWWRIVQTTFRLMQQRISSRYPERVDRPTRRAGERAGFREREVVVVRLRREKGETHDPEDVGGDANYSHRFIVSGHWRNQWYPSSSVHRQIWISPYVKGPEDQPLVVRPRRVYTWSR